MSPTPSNPTKYAIFVPRSLVLPTTQLFVDYREDALLFVHLIFRERIFKKRHRNEFIPLKMAYLRKQLTFDAARELIDGLIKAGIVETDQKFVIGHKSIGYRLRADLRDALHDRYILTNKFLIRRLQKARADDELSLPVHLALEKNMERLTLDWNAARQDVEEHYATTISALRGIDSGSATRRRKKATRTRTYELHALDSWRNGETWFIPDRFGRCHTPLTSLSKRLRRYLKLDDEDASLYEIDIVNSQPLILAMLALHWTENKKKSFSRNESQVPLFIKTNLMNFLAKWEAAYPKLIINTQPLTTIHPPPQPHPTPTPTTPQYDVGFRNAPSDARTYLDLCTEGRLYEVLAQDISRDKAKKTFFKTIFGRSIPESFSRRFPTIAEAAKWAKAKSYKDLSHLLQRTESKLMIDGVAAELIAEGRWVATIHDSVIVRKRDVKKAEQSIRYEFERWGVPARTKRTCLNVA